MTRSAITLADEQVPIITACRLIGMELPEDVDYGRSLKVHCPFGAVYHSDQGHEAAMRVYPDSNSTFCFRCGSAYRPSQLAAQAWDCTRRDAADQLLERAGFTAATPEQAWAQAINHHVPPDRTLLREALRTFCQRTAPDWDDVQFDPAVAGIYTRCLTLLDQVVSDHDATQWLTCCKQIMTQCLGSA